MENGAGMRSPRRKRNGPFELVYIPWKLPAYPGAVPELTLMIISPAADPAFPSQETGMGPTGMDPSRHPRGSCNSRRA